MDAKALRSELEPLIVERGMELDRLDVVRAGKHQVLRITLDGDGANGAGPTLDEISDATRAISAALDSSKAAGNAPFTLEVSSRGVSSPLTEPKHFRRNLTRLVKVSLTSGDVITGRIVDTTDDCVVLDVAGASRAVAFSDIAKAIVQVELNRPKGLDAEGTNDDLGDDVDDEVDVDEEDDA